MNLQVVLAKKLSIVIPVYRGATSISCLVDLLLHELDQLINTEIVLVNDDSPDSSEEVCLNIYKKHPEKVKFLSLAKNVGEHNAVMAGLNYCTGDYIVIMDDDFQNPVREVLKLVHHIQDNDFDVVYTKYKKKQHSIFRNLGSKFNDRVATILLKKPKGLYLSSFKIMNRFLVDEIIKYELPFPYIDGLILRTTSKIDSIYVEHHARVEGTSGYTLRKLISLWLNMFTNFSIVPLRVSVLIGFFFSIFSFMFGAYTVVEKILNPDLPRGYAMIIVIITMFFGIVLISIGMVGEYVGRVFLSLNRKPQFTVRKKLL